MEIKKVEKQIKVEYPKINEISNKKIKCSIPNKWLKLGVTAFLFDALMRNETFAVTPSKITPDIVTAGVITYNPIYNYVRSGCNIVSLISASTFLISSIMIIYTKLKAKKQDKKIKVSKKVKIIFIISIILFILSKIGLLIINHL